MHDASSAAELLRTVANGHIAARCLQVVAEHGVADLLGDAPARAAELAERSGLDAGALARILRLLAAHGIFSASAAGFAHTPASRLLRSDHPQSLRPLVRMRGSRVSWGGFTTLEHAVRTGKPARSWAELVAHFATHPDEAAVFNDAMVAKSMAVVPAVLDAYDFRSCGVVADIGGGPGHLLEAVLARVPTVTGVLFELPHVLRDVALRPVPRLRLAAGDFFVNALPVADVYLLMDVLHDWSDEDAGRILASVRRAAPAGARILVIETLIPDAPGPHFSKVLDVVMLTMTGGRERTRAEHAALLASAGFARSRVLPTASDYSIVEGSAGPTLP